MLTDQADVVVVGAGVAGIIAALKASHEKSSVLILSKGAGASCWLQGVNAAVKQNNSPDSPKIHFEDIIREGYGLSNQNLARDTAFHAVEVLEELRELGVNFAEDNGFLKQRHAAGSTYPRCCYVSGMMWGPKARRIIISALKKRPNVTFKHANVLRVLVDKERAVGVAAVMIPSGQPLAVSSGAVILASGGVGGIYDHSTYPRDVTGSSYALAFHAGAQLIDMEFVQFEPLVAYEPKSIRGYVIPTTLFGDGATLRDKDGKRFLLEVRPQGEPGIGKETLVLTIADMARQNRAESSGAVWLDARSVPQQVLDGYPWLFPYLMKRGVDLSKDQVAILPAAHTSLGGILVNQDRESTLSGLFAVGEAAGGIHGAGRLAGGSGTDVLASGSRAGKAATLSKHTPLNNSEIKNLFFKTFTDEVISMSPTPQERKLHSELRSLMSKSAGIWRDAKSLCEGIEKLKKIQDKISFTYPIPAGSFLVFLNDMLLVSNLILKSALSRCESRGAHQRTDHIDKDMTIFSTLIKPESDKSEKINPIKMVIHT